MRILKALHIGLMLLQLKLTLVKMEQLTETQHLSAMRSRILQQLSFCIKVHVIT